MDNVMFCIHPAISHFHAVMKFAKEIQESGRFVIFVGHENHQSYVCQHGFSYFSVGSYPFATGFEKQIYANKEDPYLDELLDRLSYKFCRARIRELSEVVVRINPTTIFIDAFSGGDLIGLSSYIRSTGCKVFFYQTMLSTIPNRKALPLNVLSLRTDPLTRTCQWMLYWWAVRRKRIWDWVRFFGRDDMSQIKRLAKHYMLPANARIDTRRMFRAGFTNIPEIILAPKELEFSAEPRANQLYYGLSIDTDRHEILTLEYRETKEHIFRFKEAGGKVVYCSFGTQYLHRKKEVERFYDTLLLIAKERTDVYFLISYNRSNLISQNICKNTYIQDPLPQIDVLKYSDLIISHGGLNSIKEAIHFEVPLLIYPLDYATDQPGNASNIYAKRLGLVGEIDNDTKQTIDFKMSALLNPHASYKQNMQEFKKMIAESGHLSVDDIGLTPVDDGSEIAPEYFGFELKEFSKT